MKLLHKTKKPKITDEALDRLLADAYDARISQAFPLRGRWQPEGLTDEVAADTASAAKEELRPIRATPAKYVRWRTAAAAILFLVSLGAGGWLLQRSLRTNPTPAGTDPISDPNGFLCRTQPANCHSAELAGETVYIFDGEYEGEYEILSADALIYGEGALREELWDEFFEIYSSEHRVDLTSALPDSLKKQQVMSYEEYLSFCCQWGLNPKYRDRDQSYLVYTFAYMSTNREVQPILSELTWADTVACLYLWINDPNPYVQYRALFPAIRVLVIPTAEQPETVELRTVMNQEDYDCRLEGYRAYQAELAEQIHASLQNCHPVELNGETVYVLNDPEAEYDGEYDVQRADNGEDFFQRREDCVSSERGMFTMTMFLQPPEGFAQKTVMAYADYAAYCETWGLTQTYHDPDQSYLVITSVFLAMEDPRLCVADVFQNEQTAAVFLWHTAGTPYNENGYFRSMNMSAWVLTVPMDQARKTVAVYEVMYESEYLLEQAELERLQKNTVETLPDGTVRIVGYADCTITSVSEPFGVVPKEFEVCIGGEKVCIWIEDTALENPDGTPFTSYDRWNYLYPGGGESWQYLCIRAEGCERIEDRGLLGSSDIYPDYRAARLIVCCDPDPEKAFEAVRPPFIPLSLDEIQARAEDPDQYCGELLFKDWVGAGFACTVFDYGGGYCCAIRNHYDGQLCGAWLFDRYLTLRQTLAGQATDLPEGDALTEALEGLTLAEVEEKYGPCLFDGGSGVDLPTWFTTDGRIVAISEFVSGEKGGLWSSERRVLTERSIPVKTDRLSDADLNTFCAEISAGVDYDAFVERCQGVEIRQRDAFNAGAARTALFYGETKLLFLVQQTEGEGAASVPIPYLQPLSVSKADFDDLRPSDRLEIVEALDPNGIYGNIRYLLDDVAWPLEPDTLHSSHYTEDGWYVCITYTGAPEGSDPGYVIQNIEFSCLAWVYTNYAMNP